MFRAAHHGFGFAVLQMGLQGYACVDWTGCITADYNGRPVSIMPIGVRREEHMDVPAGRQGRACMGLMAALYITTDTAYWSPLNLFTQLSYVAQHLPGQNA